MTMNHGKVRVITLATSCGAKILDVAALLDAWGVEVETIGAWDWLAREVAQDLFMEICARLRSKDWERDETLYAHDIQKALRVMWPEPVLRVAVERGRRASRQPLYSVSPSSPQPPSPTSGEGGAGMPAVGWN